MVQCGVMSSLASVLAPDDADTDTRLRLVALEGVENMLKAGQKLVESGQLASNTYLDAAQAAGIFEALEELQDSELPGADGLELQAKLEAVLAQWYDEAEEDSNEDEDDDDEQGAEDAQA